MDRVLIFDTTLRDGEQSPGATLNTDEKLEIARQLARMGVDIIEAGFPVASPDDFNAVRRIAELVDGSVICGLARAVEADVDRCWEAIKVAARPRIHVFMSTSDIHLEHQFRKSRLEALDATRAMVARARGYCEDIEFSPMDATRTERDYLFEVLEAALAEGATTLNIPDTVGFATPDEYGDLIAAIRRQVRGAADAIISVHCHDDLGLAVANSLAGVAAGARQVECTVNGIGERAGNAALEEIVMALRTRADVYGIGTGIDTTEIHRTSRLVSARTGILVQPNKAVVGSNAFAHESGIHQDGILKERTTYEIMDARDVGLVQNRLVLGKHSGRHAIKARLQSLGYDLTPEDLGRVVLRFKELADKKKEVSDLDLEALVADEVRTVVETFRLDGLQVTCGEPAIPTASVRLLDSKGNLHIMAATGTGPVDAAYKAIDAIVGPSIPVPYSLAEYAVQAVTAGIDAIGEVHVRVDAGPRVFLGRSGNTDIVVASARAYLDALNRLIAVGPAILEARPTPEEMAAQAATV
ncbi:MAG TPA: 2-isopropylmalate synthase [Chloroflexota bacterium]|nr:2-isopropylmalate synthase [Chloroflexota bacterium]